MMDIGFSIILTCQRTVRFHNVDSGLKLPSETSHVTT